MRSDRHSLYDETHMKTVIHPTVPLTAVLALASTGTPPARRFLKLYLGVESKAAASANAVSPGHIRWALTHTATCGEMGVAAAAGLYRPPTRRDDKGAPASPQLRASGQHRDDPRAA